MKSFKTKIMAHRRKMKKRLSAGELMKTSEGFMGNDAKVKIEENPTPEYENDGYRANIRIYPDFKVTNQVKKSSPVLAVYNATSEDIDVFIHSLVSSLITLKNAKRKLNKWNGIDEEDEEDDI